MEATKSQSKILTTLGFQASDTFGAKFPLCIPNSE